MENENQVIDMKKEIQIRKMKKSDLPQLQKMYRDLIPEGVSMEVLENNYYRTVDRPEYFLAVAADDDKVLGSTMGIVCIALDAPFLVVENVIVSGECRGQGVGRKIWNQIFKLPLYAQINTGGIDKHKKKRFIKKFLKLQVPLVLGSDCHNMKTRLPNLKQGRDSLRDIFGETLLATIDKTEERLLK